MMLRNQGEFENAVSFLCLKMCGTLTLHLFPSFSSNVNDDNYFPARQEDNQEFEDMLPEDFEAIDVENMNYEEKLPVSHRNSAPACDFDDNDRSLTCAFPCVFPLGRACGRSTGALNREQLNHLFTQFDQAPARDRKLLACVFDDKRRTETMRGVKVLSKGNSKACQKMDGIVNATGIQDKPEAAVKNPESESARQLLKTLHNCLAIAGKNQSHGSHELRNVVPTTKEISKSLGPPSAFVTCSLDSKGNPRAFRLSKAVITNHDVPAHLPEELLDEFVEKMVGDGNADRANVNFPFPMDEDARAKEGIENPIAHVQEFVAVVHSLLSVVIGIIPENFFSQMNGATTRKTTCLGKKGALGCVTSYHGVVEANNRGDLHFHVICFGSVPPHVLSDFVACPEIRKKISEVLESCCTTKLDREFVIYKAIQNVLLERKRSQLPAFVLDKQITANLLKTEKTKPTAGLTDHNSKEEICKRTRMQDSQQQLHEHILFTCSKGTTRKTTCLGKKGALGCVTSYHGVVEANNRGDLHFHVICFGSVPPHVLSDFVACPEIRKKISEVLESCCTTKLDREFVIYKAIQKAAAFHIAPCFSKEKFGFEESLLIMAHANRHIHTFDSKAEDTGTASGNTKYFVQRCLNQHCLKMEVLDCQMAAALLSMPVILRSNIFLFVDPHATLAHMADEHLD
jgi:hypothetical protein